MAISEFEDLYNEIAKPCPRRPETAEGESMRDRLYAVEH
jgi:hypothetical protein